MNSLALLLLIACSGTLGYYSGYDSHNLITRKEPTKLDERILVECPVCPDKGHWMSSNEVCTVHDNKSYKECHYGTYINNICGHRLDCFRGPGEQCTEKQEYDMFGQRCAPGYYCNVHLGVCQGWDYTVDTKVQYMLNPTPYNLGGRFKGGIDSGLIRN